MLFGHKPEGVRWYMPNEEATVSGFAIPGGMIFLGDPRYSGGDIPGRYINTALPIAGPGLGAPRPLGYYPSYDKMSSVNRREFLSWLETGRTMSVDIGYVFVFFYGLEERVSLPSLSIEEEKLILAEALRLQDRYCGNRSFRGYADSFVDGLKGRLILKSAIRPVSKRGADPMMGPEHNLALRASIHMALKGGRALPFDLACAGFEAVLAVRDGGQLKSGQKKIAFTGAEALELELEFPKRFPAGFLPRPNGSKKLVLPYRCAYASGREIDFAAGIAPANATDPLNEDWSGFGELVGDVLGTRTSLKPNLLLKNVQKQDVGSLPKRFYAWADEKCAPIGVTPLGTVVDQIHMAHFNGYLSKANYSFIRLLLAQGGFGMVPEEFEVRGRISIDQKVAVFRRDGEETQSAHQTMAAAFRFVASVAEDKREAADGIFEAFKKVCQEVLSLHALDLVQIQARVDLFHVGFYDNSDKALSRIVSGLSPYELGIVAMLLTQAIAISVPVDADIISYLAGIYSSFKIPATLLHTTLHAASAGNFTDAAGLVSVDAALPVAISHALPRGKKGARTRSQGATNPVRAGDASVAAQPAPPLPSPRFLDRARIAAISAETARVSAALSGIFADAADTSPAVERAPAPPNADGVLYHGLSVSLAKLLSRLVVQAEWVRAELVAIVKQEGQMVDGAIEAINEWSFDKFDSALIEEGDVYTLDLSLIEGSVPNSKEGQV